MIGSLLKQGAEDERKTAPRPDDVDDDLPCLESVRSEGPTVTMSITTRQSIREDLDGIAERLGVTRHQVMKYAVQLFLAHYEKGTSGIERFVVVPKMPANKIVIGDG